MSSSNNSGAHPTLAGNLLDPNVKADGQMSQGQGVGGTSEGHIREEGLEHINKNTSGPTSGAGNSSTGGLGSSSGEGLTGSSGHGSSEGGLSRGNDGVSGSSYNEGPTGQSGIGSEAERTTTGGSTGSGSGGYVQSALSYLGLGSSQGQGVAGDERNASGTSASGLDESRSGVGAGSTSTGQNLEREGAGAAGLGATEGSRGQVDRLYNDNKPQQNVSGSGLRDERYSGSEVPDRSRGEGRHEQSATQGDVAGGSSVLGGTSGTTSNDPAVDTAAGSNQPMDRDVTTGSDPTHSADPTTRDTATSSGGSAETGGDDEAARKADNKAAATRENRDAIPTAGGQKLGSKHWGESKIVPENPKPEGEGKGVSSAEGQPTDEVRDNTNKNAGSGVQTGTGGANAQGEKKEGVVGKIKDTLHIGHAADHTAK